MRTTENFFITAAGMPVPVFKSAEVRISEKLSAAKAAPMKPASVIATCIVARKRVGLSSQPKPRRYKLSVSFLSFTAFLLPLAASFSRRTSLVEMTATSVHAKSAFSAISIICRIICPIIIHILRKI